MRAAFSILRHLAIKPLCVGIFASWSCADHAIADDPAQSLPDLPSAYDKAPGYFKFDKKGASFDYGTRFEKWGAKVDEYTDANRSLTIDYGTLLTNSFGTGVTATHRNDYSEVLVNGVYAPQRDLRLRLAGGQLRGLGSGYEQVPGTVLQNNYQLDVRKSWNDNGLLSDVGVAAYGAEANSDNSAHANELAFGRQNGYLLDLGLRPTPQSKIELRREEGYLTYYFDNDERDTSHHVSHRIRYSRYFDNCLRLQGGYRTSSQSDQVDLNIARNNWQLNISRAQEGGGSDTSVRVGYAIPLSGSNRGSTSTTCSSGPDKKAPFESIVDTATKRPRYFSQEPLTTLKPDAAAQ